MHLFDAGSASLTSSRASRQGCVAHFQKCICVSPVIVVSSGCDCTIVSRSGSERELATECVLDCLESAEGDELRNVLLASECGEHARQIGG